MTRLNFVFLLLLASAISNCSGRTSGIPKQAAFSNFLKKFTYSDLPVVIRVHKDSTFFDRLGISEGADTMFLKLEGYPTLRPYCMLPDTSETYKLVWFAPADDLAPFVTTYTKSGDRMDQSAIGVGGCGVDCCFSCFETVTINKDYSINAVDSMRVWCDCDDDGNENTYPEKEYIHFRNGSIGSDGKIKMSERQERVILKDTTTISQ